MATTSDATTHTHPNYMAIFWWLLALTIAELIAATITPGPSYPQVAKVMILVSLALGKAALVALYFMHLKFEHTTLGMIAITPLILCVFLLFMLIPDRIALKLVEEERPAASAAPAAP